MKDHIVRALLRQEKDSLFDDGGEAGFTLLWILGLREGKKEPFGSVITFGQGIDWSPKEPSSEYWVAVFSRPKVCQWLFKKSATDFYDYPDDLFPGLIIHAQGREEFSWVPRSGSTDYGGSYLRCVFEVLPRHIQRKFMRFFNESKEKQRLRLERHWQYFM